MNREFSFNGNVGCGSGAPSLNLNEMAQVQLADGREARMFNCNRSQALLALARQDWQPHERIPVLINGSEIYLKPSEIIELV